MIFVLSIVNVTVLIRHVRIGHVLIIHQVKLTNLIRLPVYGRRIFFLRFSCYRARHAVWICADEVGYSVILVVFVFLSWTARPLPFLLSAVVQALVFCSWLLMGTRWIIYQVCTRSRAGRFLSGSFAGSTKRAGARGRGFSPATSPARLLQLLCFQ